MKTTGLFFSLGLIAATCAATPAMALEDPDFGAQVTPVSTAPATPVTYALDNIQFRDEGMSAPIVNGR